MASVTESDSNELHNKRHSQINEAEDSIHLKIQMEAVVLRRWRRRAGLTLEAAAQELGVSRRILSYYEAGQRPIPRTVRLAAKALEVGLSPIGHQDPSARERWVFLVSDVTAYAKGEPVVGRMLKNKETDRLRSFLQFVASGPDTRLALTDPALFRTLSEGVLRARLAGLAEFKINAPIKETSSSPDISPDVGASGL